VVEICQHMPCRLCLGQAEHDAACPYLPAADVVSTMSRRLDAPTP
jgi:hypothetical protein